MAYGGVVFGMRPEVTRTILMAAAVATAPSIVAQQGPVTFRSSVEVVRVPAVVLDGSRAVRGLTSVDFELLDSNVSQTIDVRPIEGQPVDVTLVLDVSGSIEGRALEALRADVQTIAESLQPSDRVRLLTFGSTVRDVFGFQSGGGRLPVDRIEAGGLTSFYNALAAALIVGQGTERPKLVFALTDGMDNSSFLDAGSIASLARTTSAVLYLALIHPNDPIRRFDNGISPLGKEQSTIDYGQNVSGVYHGYSVRRSTGPYFGPPDIAVLRLAAGRTGGRIYEKVHDSLPSRFMQALEEFRSGYLLSYSPTGLTSSGWHEITVRMKNHKYKVRARNGYEN